MAEYNVEEAFQRLLEKVKASVINPDVELITLAFETARKAHKEQKRLSGEPYICHPLEVACILADMSMDSQTVAAGLLHDVIEDTEIDYAYVKNTFGQEIATMVDGVTKLGKINFTTQEEEQIENLRKMFIATAKDVRVMLIKLADRLHNIRTLGAMPDQKRRKKARETIEVYAPIAHRLGMSKIKLEMEDTALMYLDPVAYEEIKQEVEEKKRKNKNYIEVIQKTIAEKLKEIGVEGQLQGRVKHYYSIFRKIYGQNKSFDEIYDIFAVRVIVNTIPDCYAVLGAIHDLYKPIPGRIKDYIAMPKPNMYQSLHSTVMGHEGTPFEIQIRTKEMHMVAEYGIAAHWKYKEGAKATTNIDSKLAWIRQVLELQKDMKDEDEFMRVLKIDMFADEVFVFTPKGDVVSLPAGSCPIDFAYAIHSAVGSKMMGAKVNGKLVPLDYVLQNGDIVDILTSSAIHGPSRDWLKIVKTSSARSKINQDENIAHGKELFEKEAKRTGFSMSQLTGGDMLEPIFKKYAFNSIEDMYAAIGYGGVSATKLVMRLKEECKKNIEPEEERPLEPTAPKKQHKTSSNGIVVKGIDNCLVRLSRCCSPVPGDEIVGYVTRGRGVSVHRKDCINVRQNYVGEGHSDRLIEVAWEKEEKGQEYQAEILLIADDRVSILADITAAVSFFKVSTSNLNARISKEGVATVTLQVEITSSAQLDEVIKKLRGIAGVIKVERSMQ